MSRIAYVNGRYFPLAAASVNVEDRGYQFSDGVYEVCEVREGRLVDERRHMARLAFSLSELRIDMPMSPRMRLIGPVRAKHRKVATQAATMATMPATWP